MYHVVIDLEMCRVPRRSSADYRCRMETIQIGAVLLDENFVRIGTLSEYVNLRNASYLTATSTRRKRIPGPGTQMKSIPTGHGGLRGVMMENGN